jgi:hypothetical protein
MPLNFTRARALLREAKFRFLFIEELGWDHYNATLDVSVQGSSTTLSAIAQKRGMVAYHCPTPAGQTMPEYALRRKIEHQAAKSALEHLIVFTDAGKTTQIWQWVKREPGKPAACREHTTIIPSRAMRCCRSSKQLPSTWMRRKSLRWST